MIIMKKMLLALMILCTSTLSAKTYTDVYDVKMKLHIPRVFDNT